MCHKKGKEGCIRILEMLSWAKKERLRTTVLCLNIFNSILFRKLRFTHAINNHKCKELLRCLNSHFNNFVKRALMDARDKIIKIREIKTTLELQKPIFIFIVDDEYDRV